MSVGEISAVCDTRHTTHPSKYLTLVFLRVPRTLQVLTAAQFQVSLSARDLGRSPLDGNFPRVFGHPPCRPRPASLCARATPRCRVVQTSLGRARVLASLFVGAAVAHAIVRLLRMCFRRGVGLVVLSCYVVAHRACLVCVWCVGDTHARRCVVLWWPLGHQGT